MIFMDSCCISSLLVAWVVVLMRVEILMTNTYMRIDDWSALPYTWAMQLASILLANALFDDENVGYGGSSGSHERF